MVQAPEGIRVGKTERLIYTRTDLAGHVVQKFGFDRRLGGEQGYVRLARPWVQIFSEDRWLVTIEATMGTVPVESDEGEMRLPERGELQDATVTLRRLPDGLVQVPLPGEDGADRLGPVEMTVDLAGEVDFQLEFSRLESPGRVEVRSEQFEVTGQGLMLEYDQVRNRLQVLELERLIEPLRIRGLASQKKETKSEDPEPTGQPKATAPAQEHDISTYRLALEDHVVITRLGAPIGPDASESAQDVLYADRVEVLADFDSERLKQGGGGPEEAAASPGEPKKPEAEKNETIEIMCQGVLRIDLAGEGAGQPPAPGEERLEFTATGKPARIYQADQLVVEAQRIYYRMADEVMELSGQPQQPARFYKANYVSASEFIHFDPNGLATLTGPGRVSYATDKGEPGHIEYAGQLTVKLLPDADPNSTHYRPEWLEFSGRLLAQEPNTLVQAQGGRLTFFEPLEKGTRGKTPNAQIRTIELLKPDAVVENARFKAGRLAATFARTPQGKSQPHEITAWDNVWSDNPEYTLEARDKLELHFATAAESTAQAQDSEVPGLFTSMRLDDLSSVTAQGHGGGVMLLDKRQQFRITGDQAQRDPNGIWAITGQPAQVAGLADQGTLTGSRIVADEINETCFVSGSGQLEAVMPGELLGPGESIPLDVAWSRGARYDLKTGQVQLEGVQARTNQTKKGLESSSELTCATLALVLVPQEGTDAIAENDLLGGGQRLESLRAAGPGVRLVHTDREPNTSTPLRRMEMAVPWLELEAGGAELSAGPGWIQADDLVGRGLGGGGAAAAIAEMFRGDAPTRSLLQYAGGMAYHKGQRRLHFDGPVALDQAPLAAGEVPDAAALARAAGVRRLDYDTLTVILAEEEAAGAAGEAQPPAGSRGALGDLAGRVQKVTATGRVFVEAVFEDGSEHFFAGEELIWHGATEVLSVRGTESMPAQLDGMGFSEIRWDQKAAALQAVPVGTSVVGGF
jgi:hypothetical protein